MYKNKRVIDEFSIKGKRVFIRADFNVPLDANSNITDDTRIRSTLPTINYAIDEGAVVILGSHLGRPNGEVVPSLSMAPIAKRLERFLKKDVKFVDDCIGDKVLSVISNAGPGDIILIENLRFHKGEKENDPDFAKDLSQLCDVYVNDAFGAAHRSHASITGITKFVETSCIGFLMKEEIDCLEEIVQHPVRPFIAILGGAKVSGKIGVIENLGKKVDKVIIGGGMAFTFFKAMGLEVGKSIVEEAMFDVALRIRDNARNLGVKFYLPVDCVVATSLAPDAETKIVPIQEIPKDWIGLDIGPASVRLFTEVLENVKTILWNGPMGVFEMDAYSRGTFAIAHAVANSYAFSVIGGGDTAHAIHKARETENISFISTGGGAALQFLEEKGLPGLDCLLDKEIVD